jgi:hypothetical protein
MTTVTLVCTTCGYKAKRRLREQVSCRGTRETAAELALCPKGHGELVRVDGVIQRDGCVVGRSKRVVIKPAFKRKRYQP